MMPKGKNARAHGQGSIWTEPRTRGRSVYVGQVRVGNRQFQRTLGDVRKAGSKDGLTRSMAEARLRVVRDEIEQDLRDAHPSPENPADATLNVVGEAYLDHLESFYRRKRATIQDYRIMLRRHLVPFFEDAPVASITKRDVESFVRTKQKTLAVSTVSGLLIFLHGVLKYAAEEGLTQGNAVADARRPP
jgi:hypothetical protein